MTIKERLAAAYEWMREPDYAEHFSVNDLLKWANRRDVGAHRDALAEIERLEAEVARLREDGGWLPIEGAPRTGEWFAAWRKHGVRMLMVRWDEQFACFEDDDGNHVYDLAHYRPPSPIPPVKP